MASAPSAMRKPSGDQRRRLRRAGAPARPHLVALALQRIDPQIERRARGESCSLLRTLVAEDARELRVEPFGIVAGDMRRRARREVRLREPRAFRLAQRRRRKAAAVGEPRDRVDVETAFALEHAEHDRARRLRRP